MKNILFLCLCVSSTFSNAFAQASAYSFASSSGTYTPIVGTTALSGSLGTNTAVNLPIGFTFSFSGVGYTQFAVSTDGYLKFQAATLSSLFTNTNPLSSGSGETNVVSAASTDLIGGLVFRGTSAVNTGTVAINAATLSTDALASIAAGQTLEESSSFPSSTCKMVFASGTTTISSVSGTTVNFSPSLPATGYINSGCATGTYAGVPTQVNNGVVSYTTQGTAPNRKLVVQWKSFRATGSGPGDWMNFQIILEETTNKINIVYGTFQTLEINTNRFYVGIRTTGSDFKAISNHNATSLGTSPRLSNTWAAPIVIPNATVTTMGSSYFHQSTMFNDNIPPSGLTYTFSPPLCSPPSVVNLTELSQTGGKINWTAPAGGTVPTSYDAEVLLSATAYTNSPSAGLSGVASGVAIPTTLTAGTAYKTQVRSNCGVDGFSTWTTSTAFTTLCAAVALPLTQGFNSTSIPTCWTTSSSNILFSTSSQSGPTAYSYEGSGMLRLLSGLAPAQQERVVVQPVSTVGLAKGEVSFAMFEDNGVGSGSANDKVLVQYSTNFGTTWTTIAENKRAFSGLVNNRWVKRYFALPSGALEQANLLVSLAFVIDPATTSVSLSKMYVDDFTINDGGTIKNADANTCVTSALAAGGATTAQGTSAAAAAINNAPLGGNNWFRITDGGQIIAEINPNGNDLGVVTVKYLENLAGAANVDTVSAARLLPRKISIKPTNAPTTAVSVRFYYMDTELAAYDTATGFSNKTISQLGISKKPVASEDCDPTNNGPTGGVSITPTAVDYGAGFYLEFTTTSFSEFAAVAAGVILAAELTKFTAKKSGDYNQIAWATASEKNVSNFVVERSVDGQNNWSAIGSVKAFGTSTAEKTYSFNDVLPTTTAYYRLVTNDNDGKAATSKTVSVVRGSKYLTVQSIAPNPTTEGVNIDASVNKTSNINVVVTDVLGKVVKAQTFSASEGNNTMRLSLSNLAHGTYIFTINDGETIVTKRVVKQ